MHKTTPGKLKIKHESESIKLLEETIEIWYDNGFHVT